MTLIDGTDLKGHFQAFIHAPFKDDQDEDKNDTSLSLNKSFPLRETVRVQFRGELFNPLNHPIFGGPTVQYGNAAFGTIAGQLNRPRNIQLGLKYVF